MHAFHMNSVDVPFEQEVKRAFIFRVVALNYFIYDVNTVFDDAFSLSSAVS